MNHTFLKRLGIKIGHVTKKDDLTGVTVFIIEDGAQIGIDIRGSSTGSFNTHAYGEITSARTVIHAIVFSGGSAFGMESFTGVMEYLYENNIGARFGLEKISGVTGGVIYDRIVGKMSHPLKSDGYNAAKQASCLEYQMGNIGVGTGATMGKWTNGTRMKGGFGMAATQIHSDIVAAFVVINACGDVVHRTTKQWYVDFGGYPYGENADQTPQSQSSNTTLALVATTIDLDRAALSKIASRCQDAFARAIFPVHTMVDGDMVFAISTKRDGLRKKRNAMNVSLDQICLAAEEAVINAIKISVMSASGIAGFPAYRDIVLR